MLSSSGCSVSKRFRWSVSDRHQQIDDWRGAVIAMEKRDGCRKAFLTLSFRFGQTIAAAASSVIAAIGEEATVARQPGRYQHHRPLEGHGKRHGPTPVVQKRGAVALWFSSVKPA